MSDRVRWVALCVTPGSSGGFVAIHMDGGVRYDYFTRTRHWYRTETAAGLYEEFVHEKHVPDEVRLIVRLECA